jgi:N-acetylglucosaminyldiphosphoundecaprenol N-acetyl-beta-D-mannosaminyltransferase
MTCWLGGVRFDNVTMNEAVTAIVRMAQKSEKPCLVCTANLDHLAMMQNDGDFRQIYREADFVVADGMPLIWLSQIAGTPLKERVAGSDLFWELGRASELTGVRLFLLGGQPTAAEKAASKLYVQCPDAQVAGTYCPPFGQLDDPEEDAHIRQIIAEAQPDILLVGLGSPKQEKWIAAHRHDLNVPVCIGVGATFDMAAGMVRRAPLWIQHMGLEWLFRLVQEPRRLWSRYMGRDLQYLFRLAALTIRVRFRPDGKARDEISRAAQ